MSYVYKGYLFGCYNSRGGSTFVEADDQHDALVRYSAMYEPDENDILLKDIEEEEFIGEATLTCYREPEAQEDLDGAMNDGPEYRSDANENGVTTWVMGELPPEFSNTFADAPMSVQTDPPYDLRFGPRPTDGPSYGPRWDDDAAGLIFVPKGKNTINEDC